MISSIVGFFSSISNAAMFVVAIVIFFGIMAGVFWMNQRERVYDHTCNCDHSGEEE